ncbi:hypothetical protein SRCM100623_00788 [Acetobacter pasteurianus]|uniref:Uncharacterized protein n=1 Tax=Acetobacter pasteurianus TaxID=438 RepID=A0A1A0DEG5_ACEPA|nr:hypothetical protein SRCM100623_00788 [Acetobacter pasteurianus]
MENLWLVAFSALYLSYFATRDASEKIREATFSLTACRQLSRMMIEANCTAARKVDFSLS